MHEFQMFHFVVAVVVAVAQTAPTDKVPTYDVAAACQAAASQPDASHGPSKADDIKHCLDAEGRARDELVKQWSEFTPAARTVCLGVSSAGSVKPVYSELIACLDRMRPPQRGR